MTEVDFTDPRWEAFKAGYLARREDRSHNGWEVGPPSTLEWKTIKRKYSTWLMDQGRAPDGKEEQAHPHGSTPEHQV